MHPVPGRVVSLDRQEGTGADMQCHPLEGHPPFCKPLNQRFGEMQTGSRGRDGTVLAGKERLIISPILLVRLTAGRDIGRQRHLAPLGNGLVQNRTMEGKRQSYLASLIFLCNLSIELAEKTNFSLCSEAEPVPGLELLGWFDEGPPVRAVQPLVQGCLNSRRRASAPDTAASETRRNHLAVIDHQAIARPQQVRQVANDVVDQFLRVARFNDQKPGGIARNRRPQRDPVRGKLEIEKVGFHAFPWSCPALGSGLRPARAQALCRASTYSAWHVQRRGWPGQARP